MTLRLLLFLSFCLLSSAQDDLHHQQHHYPTTTPVPILKQINRHNEDGSYSYGFEAADGSYKIESKYPTGEVFGKYGFVDDSGNLREIEYGAGKNRGFEPAGSGINVPPPAPVSSNSINEPEDDGQYREDPSIYHTDPKYTNGEQYDPVPPRYPAQYQRLHVPASAYKPQPSSFPQHSAAYRQQRPIAVQQPVQHEQLQQYHQEEYRPQYRSTAAQSHYEPRAAAAAYRPQEGQPVHQGYQVPSAGLGSGRYTVNF